MSSSIRHVYTVCDDICHTGEITRGPCSTQRTEMRLGGQPFIHLRYILSVSHHLGGDCHYLIFIPTYQNALLSDCVRHDVKRKRRKRERESHAVYDYRRKCREEMKRN